MKDTLGIAVVTPAAAWILALAGMVAPAYAAASGIQFAPHRAVYEMTLDDASAAQNIAAVRGRLVFELKGSACAGYTLNNRMVTRIVDAEGTEVVSDIRSTSWEDGSGDTFRFSTSQYLNNTLTEEVSGTAQRTGNGDTLRVKLEEPGSSVLVLDGKAHFPTQFSLEILEAAHQQKRSLQRKVYDGSEAGDKLFLTTTFIGEPADNGKDGGEMPNGKELAGLRSWPVSISYFEADTNDDATPRYQLAFQLYENGVSRSLRIDYGTFALKGELSSLELHTPQPCPEL
jgi:hypothetical protein